MKSFPRYGFEEPGHNQVIQEEFVYSDGELTVQRKPARFDIEASTRNRHEKMGLHVHGELRKPGVANAPLIFYACTLLHHHRCVMVHGIPPSSSF